MEFWTQTDIMRFKPLIKKPVSNRVIPVSGKLLRPKNTIDYTYSLFERVCVSKGLPEPVREYVFTKNSKYCKGRKWRIDFAWVDAKIALEINGGIFSRGRHVRPKGYIKDMEKFTEIALHGWILILITPKQAYHDKTFSMIQRALELSNLRG